MSICSSLVYQWTLKLEPRSALKRSVDMVLCAMCYVKPVLFPTLLQHMGALVPISATNHAASISDDRLVMDTESTGMDIYKFLEGAKKFKLL